MPWHPNNQKSIVDAQTQPIPMSGSQSTNIGRFGVRLFALAVEFAAGSYLNALCPNPAAFQLYGLSGGNAKQRLAFSNFARQTKSKSLLAVKGLGFRL